MKEARSLSRLQKRKKVRLSGSLSTRAQDEERNERGEKPVPIAKAKEDVIIGKPLHPCSE